MKVRSTLLLALVGFIAASGTQSARQPIPRAPASAAQSATLPNFARDIAPIIYRSCASCHHPGQAAPFSLMSYEDAKAHAQQIAVSTRSRAMPPWLPEPGYGDFVNDSRLSDGAIHLIDVWVKAGAPEGPPSEVPPSPHFTEGWQLGAPDMIVEATRAFTVPSSGPDVFWNFIFSPPIATRRYVRAIEVRPGVPHAVHHANVLVDRSRSARLQEIAPGAGFPGMDVKISNNLFDLTSHFLFWKPGNVPWVEPDGLAWELDPGNDLVLNAHFMTMGMPMQVKPSIGLYFTDKPPTSFPLVFELEHDGALNIPPGARDFTVADDFTLPLDVNVLAVYPHAHELGHVLEGYATLPSGERKWLIRIPQWDPDWQAVFHYRKPVFLPKGTILSMRWHYDNSTANPRNPHNPPVRVRQGDQSTDEMSHLSFQVLPVGPGDQRRELAEALMRHTLEKYPDDFAAHVGLGAIMLSRLNPNGAVSQLEDAVRIDPKQAEGHNWLGIALGVVGRSRESMDQFRAALAIQPNYTDARYNLAKALAKSGQLDEALKDFTQVMAASPQDTQMRKDFVELLTRLGKSAKDVEPLTIGPEPSQQKARKDQDLAPAQSGTH